MTATLIADLEAHLALCREVLAVVEREHHALGSTEKQSSFEAFQSRKQLLPRLTDAVQRLKAHRSAWRQLPAPVRAQHPHVPRLLRENQDLIMKIIVLDRENEQQLLRRGLVPPRHLPSVNTQRPHYVADLYRRGAAQTNPSDAHRKDHPSGR